MAIQRSSGAALPSAEERHEWASFLALIPMFDLREIDSEQYQRCLRAVWLCSNTGRISRDELKARAGLAFDRDAPGVDLILAKLVRERVLAPIKSQPFRFRITERHCHPDSTYAGDDERFLTQGACEEQAIRLRTIHDLERGLRDPKCIRKRDDQLRKYLDHSREVYQAAWLELENAIGTERACECRRRIESQTFNGGEQLVLLFPQNKHTS